jgi:hypothetical protein
LIQNKFVVTPSPEGTLENGSINRLETVLLVSFQTENSYDLIAAKIENNGILLPKNQCCETIRYECIKLEFIVFFNIK